MFRKVLYHSLYIIHVKWFPQATAAQPGLPLAHLQKKRDLTVYVFIEITSDMTGENRKKKQRNNGKEGDIAKPASPTANTERKRQSWKG